MAWHIPQGSQPLLFWEFYRVKIGLYNSHEILTLLGCLQIGSGTEAALQAQELPSQLAPRPLLALSAYHEATSLLFPSSSKLGSFHCPRTDPATRRCLCLCHPLFFVLVVVEITAGTFQYYLYIHIALSPSGVISIMSYLTAENTEAPCGPVTLRVGTSFSVLCHYTVPQ